MKLLKYTLIFLVINFGALALGSLLMANGPQESWYENLNKAPWTPPGWVFGVAWTTIMVCFSLYMAFLYYVLPTSNVLGLFIAQLSLNVSWNYIFFNQHFIGLGFLVIVALAFVIGLLTICYIKTIKYKTLLIAPYFIWLCIATSLNGYILLEN
ncbi:tryptophan-rich sensory protein [Flavobacteriaceae bacterium MHTCC 0001]